MANLTADNDIQIIDNKATIIGTSEADEILATQTNDHLMIRILAGAGDDIVLVNSGNNEVYGEAGNDLFSILTIGNHTVDGGNGQDTVRLWSVDPYSLSSYVNDNGVITLSSNFATHTFTNVEVFSFYFTLPYPYIERVLSVAELDAFYNSQDQVLIGTVNDDVLIGAFGNDTINGTDGADTIDGRQGDDTLNGGAGNDIIIGNEGNNTINGGDLFSSHLSPKSTNTSSFKSSNQVNSKHRYLEIDGYEIKVARKVIDINGEIFETDDNPVIINTLKNV